MELKRYLRVVASTGDNDDDYSMVEISNRRAREAADRIEKLEAALREVCKDWDSPIFDSDWEALVELCRVFSERKRIAREALEGKDD
jgi:hypothetical protein